MHNKSTITIKDISELSGYSVSTVSKALNDKNDISIKTKEEIKRIASAYNFRPNNYAVALRSQQSKAIAVVLPEITITPYNQVLGSLQKNADQLGYKILFFQTFNSVIKEEECVNNLSDGSIDAVIIISQKNMTNNYNNSLPLGQIDISSVKTEEDINKISIDCLYNVLGKAS